MDQLDTFFNEHGYFGNIKKLFHQSFDVIINKLEQHYFEKGSITIRYNEVLPEIDCRKQDKTRIVSFYYKNRQLLYIPYMTEDGYFVLNGKNWMIFSLDIEYTNQPEIFKQHITAKNDYANTVVSKYRIPGFRYYETVIFTYHNSLNVYLNYFINEFNLNKSLYIYGKSISAFIVYYILKNKQTNLDEMINDICFWAPNSAVRKSISEKSKMVFFTDFANVEDLEKVCIAKVKSVFSNSASKKYKDNGPSVWDRVCQLVSKYFLIHEVIEKETVFDANVSGKYVIGKVNTQKEKGAKRECKEYVAALSQEQITLNMERKIRQFTYIMYLLFTTQEEDISVNKKDKMVNKKIDVVPYFIERFFIEKINLFNMESVSKTHPHYFYEKSLIKYLNDCSANLIKEQLIKNRRVSSFLRHIDKVNIDTLSARTVLDIYSQFRKVKLNSSAENPNMEIRKLQDDHLGFYCISETSDSAEAGLIKYLASTAIVADEYDLFNEIQPFVSSNGSKLFVNGYYYATVLPTFFSHVRALKRRPEYRYVSIVQKIANDSLLWLYTDKGRLCRPFFYKPYNQIMYFDQFEMYNHDLVFAEKDREFANCIELHPSVMFGLSASFNPFANHSQGARAVFQAQMNKQVVGYDLRHYQSAHVEKYNLWFGQRELCSTYMSRRFNNEERRMGQNVMIAMLPMGFNQDDGLVAKLEAVQRGMFAYDKRDTVTDNERDSDKFEPLKASFETVHTGDVYKENGIIINYDQQFRFKNGIIQQDMRIQRNTLISKYLSKMYHYDAALANEKDSTLFVDTDVLECKHTNCIDDVTGINKQIFFMETSNSHYIIEGDKLASRGTAQKGIISRLVPTKDLPYTEDGVTPDIIINPHSIPSRMTISHILETFIAKEVVNGNPSFGDGTYFDCTAFEDIDMCTYLEESPEEHVVFYNPRTGEPMKGKVYFGVCYYQQLKHHVHQKMFYRTVGAKNVLTRQPVEGKLHDGGLRLGNMEIDALYAHNAIEIISQKLKNESDNIDLYYCTKCFHMFQSPAYDCVMCNTTETLAICKTTNIFNVVATYLTAAGVELQINKE